MRKKIALLTAAVFAVGTLASQAAAVYSLNIVGYATVNIPNGFSIFAPPFDVDNTGLNNTLANVFAGNTNIPNGFVVYPFVGGTFPNTVTYFNGNWFGANQSLNCGSAVFTFNGGAAFNVVLTGNVLQGPLTNTLPAGFTLASSKVPLAGDLKNTLNFTTGVGNGDTVIPFDVPTQGYPQTYTFFGGSWFPGTSSIAIGQGFWVQSAAGGNWVVNFTVL